MSSLMILHGKRRFFFFELQKWRHLRLSVQKASPFSSAETVSRKGQNFSVSAFLVESLGLTTKLAESISRKVSYNEKGNINSVLSLFRTHGFTDSQISTIITVYPQVLIIADSLAPKLEFLNTRGASTSELTEVLSKVPKILASKKNKAFSRYYDFAKDIIEADNSYKFKKLCPSLLPQGIKQVNKIRNISVLRELGMPQKLLFSLLTSHVQLVCGKDKFEESLKKVLAMGFDPTTYRFLEALRILMGLSNETIQGRVEVYNTLGFTLEDVWTIFKKWPIFIGYSDKNIADSIQTFLEIGFSRDEVVMIVKRFPQCLGLSLELVKKKADFLLKKEMNWPLKALVSNPSVIGLSIEKRMVPRCNVIKALISKGFLGSELPSIQSVLLCTDKAFLNKYVMKHDDEQIVAELMAIFTRGPVSTQ